MQLWRKSDAISDNKSNGCKNATVQIENGRAVFRQIDYYRLDVIISVGYRVKSVRGMQFRIWANQVLKDYLLRGYAVQARIDLLEQRMDKKIMEHEQRISDNEKQIELFVRKALPPVEGVFCDGQIFVPTCNDFDKIPALYVRNGWGNLIACKSTTII